MRSFSFKNAKALGASFKLKTAQIVALSAFARTLLASALPPRASSRASIAIDFPAPVSPVIALIPFDSSREVFFTTA